MEAKSLWAELKRDILNHKKNSSVFQSWLNSIQPVNFEENTEKVLFTLQIPSDLHKRWIQENVIKDLSRQITRRYQKPCGIRFKVTVPDLPVPFHLKKIQGVKKTNNVFFNSDYTFKSFIVGKNNEFAFGACLSIAKQEKGFNPLFICGPSGLGKTHLLNAIGQEIQKKAPQARILYLSAERFLNECIHSIQNRKMSAFQEKYRKNVDVLLMDDIQMIAKGCAVQEEFFHTFNDLYHRNVQVVVCCDKFPSQIPNLEERIRTRLDGGLVVDISYPDMETKLAILRHKMDKKNLLLSEKFLLKIAASCGKSVREMEGVLNKIKMMEDLHKGALSSEHVERILKSLIPKECTPEEIQKQVARAFSVCIEDMRGKSRTKNIVTARQTSMFLIKTLLRKSLNDVGRLFGGRDHTTVINSLKKVKKLRLEDPAFKRILDDLHKDLHSFSHK